MLKTYRISEKEVKVLRERMKECKKVHVYRRMEAVAMRGEGKSNEEIGPMTGFHPDWVSKLVSRFYREGMNALLEDGRHGGNNQNLTNEEEAKLLKEFEGAASDGQIITPGGNQKEI